MFVINPHSRDLRFPSVRLASPQGLLAVGGDLRTERLLEAYRSGIFPWYNPGQPILWWSPDPRTVLFPEQLHVSRSLRKTLRKMRFRVTLDTDFSGVIAGCAAPRDKSEAAGTWITPEMQAAYQRLHALGYAHSVETWLDDRLVGGLYGVALGRAFFGESMFSRVSDASKTAFVHLVGQLMRWNFSLIDCQLATEHLFSLGAQEIARASFIALLHDALADGEDPKRWQFDEDLTLPA